MINPNPAAQLPGHRRPAFIGLIRVTFPDLLHISPGKGKVQTPSWEEVFPQKPSLSSGNTR